MGWDLDDYEPVADRLAAFHDRHIAGKVYTEILSTEAQHDVGLFIVKASVYRGDELREDKPAATGLAAELASKTGVNSTSPLENCETSAIGRALANLGFAAKKSARASREEMAKVIRTSGSGDANSADPSDAIGGKSSDSDPDSGPVSSRGMGAGPDTTSEGEKVLREGKPGSNSPSDDNATVHVHDWSDHWTDAHGKVQAARTGWVVCSSCGKAEMAKRVSA